MILRRITQHLKDQNWTAIAIDFVIVVIGVGVALAGQQWLADRQQKEDLEQTELLLQEHLYVNYANAKERAAAKACRTEVTRALAAKLLEPEGAWLGMPAPETGQVVRTLPATLVSSYRVWGSEIWEAGLAQGTFNNMNPGRKNWLTSIFTQANMVQDFQEDIFKLQAKLKALAVPSTLSQSDRLRYYDTLAELDELSGMMDLSVEQLAARIEYVGIDLSPERRQRALNEMAEDNETLRNRYGDCFEPMTFPVFDVPSDEADEQ